MNDANIIYVDLVKALGNRRSFVSGEPDGDRIRIRFFKNTSNGTLGAKVWFGTGSEGAPGLVHGGAVAAVLEETMRFAAWVTGHAVFSVRLATNFKQMLPSNTDASVATAVEVLDATKIRVTGHMFDSVGAPVADGEAFFLIVPSAKFGVDADKVAAMFAALQ
jgi:acyl-coenzyme A thioesterase PaaI-like protein